MYVLTDSEKGYVYRNNRIRKSFKLEFTGKQRNCAAVIVSEETSQVVTNLSIVNSYILYETLQHDKKRGNTDVFTILKILGDFRQDRIRTCNVNFQNQIKRKTLCNEGR